MQLSLVSIAAALTTGVVAIPTSLVHAGITARDGGYDRWNGIYCTNPCPKCNLEKISPADLIVQAYTIDINQSYCVTSDGSDYPDAAGNWRLLNGCGPNNAAIWLQSYAKGPWCLPGTSIRVIVSALSQACQNSPGDSVYGFIRVSDDKHFVQVGRSVGCAEGTA